MYNFFKKYFTIVGSQRNKKYNFCLFWIIIMVNVSALFRFFYPFFYVNRIQLIFVIYFCIFVLFLLILFYDIRWLRLYVRILILFSWSLWKNFQVYWTDSLTCSPRHENRHQYLLLRIRTTIFARNPCRVTNLHFKYFSQETKSN